MLHKGFLGFRRVLQAFKKVLQVSNDGVLKRMQGSKSVR